MQLFEGVHLVASGSGGLDLTDAYDCNAYLLDAGPEAALIDCGIGTAVDALLENVERAGVAPQALHTLSLTHAIGRSRTARALP